MQRPKIFKVPELIWRGYIWVIFALCKEVSPAASLGRPHEPYCLRGSGVEGEVETAQNWTRSQLPFWGWLAYLEVTVL